MSDTLRLPRLMFSSFRYNPRNEAAGSYGDSLFTQSISLSVNHPNSQYQSVILAGLELMIVESHSTEDLRVQV